MTISKATANILDQLIDVIQQLSVDEYIRPLNIYNGSTIGKHFRHIHDFYACLINGNREKCVDYCKRERAENLELTPSSIIESFNDLKKKVRELDPSETVEVYGDFEFENGHRPVSQSSFGREMLYAYDHAVHHLAIIKLGIRAEFPDVIIENDIGVAASTLRHQLIHE
tara:strand:+ start:5519 stop:6025 length:507 start_codon:yes stop_codon:yes gene_type:complete